MDTEAPRMTPPLLSITRPEIVPVGVCAAAKAGRRNKAELARTSRASNVG